MSAPPNYAPRQSKDAPRPRAEFRPNPSRSIFLSGVINEELVYRLTPAIVQMLHGSREPVTVYIDSPGGSTAHASDILALVRAPSQDSPRPCRLITVTTRQAYSAAASFLCAGDYAIAYPGSLIHFHGVRQYREDAITVEKASDVAKDLKASNNRSAAVLRRNCSERFFFRFVSLRREFADYRKANPAAVHEKDCFLGIISQKLTPLGAEVVKKAEGRVQRYDKLWDRVLGARNVKRLIAGPEGYDKLEAAMLRAIVSFEYERHKNTTGWTFATQGLAQVNDDFLLLNEYIGHHQRHWIETFCERWKDFVLEDQDKAQIENLPEGERKDARVAKLRPVLLPLWLFFGAVCHGLQEAENPLTPDDAFWLGLIDEVVGSDLPTLRKVVEQGPASQKTAPAP